MSVYVYMYMYVYVYIGMLHLIYLTLTNKHWGVKQQELVIQPCKGKTVGFSKLCSKG